MVEQAEIVNQLESLIQPVLEDQNYDLVDIEYGRERGRGVVRVYIDRPEGITIDDCESVSQEISSILDMHENMVPGSYILEVSSPGMDRPFKKTADFVRNIGKRVKIVTKNPIQRQNVYIGHLYDLQMGDTLETTRIFLKEETTGHDMEFRLSDIANAHREIKWNHIFGEIKKKGKNK